jgi:aminoglycoside phosphotransferase (APT) family kinase protein
MTEPWEHAEVEVDVELVRALLAEQMPTLSGAAVAPLDEGWDSRAFLVDGAWVFRFPKRGGPDARLGVEIALLPALASRLPVAIPGFEHIGTPSARYPYRFVGYRCLPGRGAEEAWGSFDPSAVGAALGRVLGALHASPASEASAAGVEPDPWRDDLPGRARDVDMWLAKMPAVQRARFEALRDPPPRHPGAPRLLHGDLMPYHVLVDGGTLSGLIDWGDVCLGDPAIDLGGVLYLGGPAALRACLDAYRQPIDAGAVARARYVALFAAAMDVVWAAATGRAASLAAAWRAVDFCDTMRVGERQPGP